MGEPHSDGRKNNGKKPGEPHQTYPNSDSLIPLTNWRQAKLKLRRDKVAGGSHLPPSKITNGQDAILDKSRIPQREAWVARLNQIHVALLGDLGGESNFSVAEYSLSRRCATLSIELDWKAGSRIRAMLNHGSSSCPHAQFHAQDPRDARAATPTTGYRSAAVGLCQAIFP